MLAEKTNFVVRILEFGKYFLKDGASDFFELAYTRGLQGYSRDLRQALSFPEQSSFRHQFGRVSVALVPLGFEVDFNSEYVLAQVHRRREAEFSANSPSDRLYNQIRFVLITAVEVRNAYRKGFALYPALLVRDKNNRDEVKRYWLNKYEGHDLLIGKPHNTITLKAPHEDTDFPLPYLWRYQNGELSAEVRSRINQVAALATAIFSHERAQFNGSGLNIDEKMLLVDDVQRLIFPKLQNNLLTFALDHITTRSVRLQFSENAPTLSPARIQQETYGYWMLKFFEKRPAWNWQQANEAIHDELVTNTLNQGGTARDAVTSYVFVHYPAYIREWTGETWVAAFHRIHSFVDQSIIMKVLQKRFTTYLSQAPQSESANDKPRQELISLLNEFDIALGKKVLNSFRDSLAQFSKVFLLIQNPQNIHLQILTLAIQQNESANLSQVKSPKFLQILLELRKNGPIWFRDKKELLVAFVSETAVQFDKAIKDCLVKGQLIPEILNAFDVSTRNDPLLPFLTQIEKPDIEIFARFCSLLNTPEQISHLVASFKQFQALLNGRPSLNQTTSNELRQQIIGNLRELCTHVAHQEIQFADWLIFNEALFFELTKNDDDAHELYKTTILIWVAKFGQLANVTELLGQISPQFRSLLAKYLNSKESLMSTSLWEDVNGSERLFKTAVRSQIEQNKVVPIDDISERLIEWQVRDAAYGQLLRKIALSEVQQSNLFQLSSERMVNWLKEANLDGDYQNRLYYIARHLQEKKANLIWYVLQKVLPYLTLDFRQKQQDYAEWIQIAKNKSLKTSSPLHYLVQPHPHSSYWRETSATDNDHELFRMAVMYAFQPGDFTAIPTEEDVLRFIEVNQTELYNFKEFILQAANEAPRVFSQLEPSLNLKCLENTEPKDDKNRRIHLIRTIAAQSILSEALVERILWKELAVIHLQEALEIFLILRDNSRSLWNLQPILKQPGSYLSDYWSHARGNERLFLCAVLTTSPFFPGSQDLMQLLEISRKNQFVTLQTQIGEILNQLTQQESSTRWRTLFMQEITHPQDFQVLYELCKWCVNQDDGIILLPIVKSLVDECQRLKKIEGPHLLPTAKATNKLQNREKTSDSQHFRSGAREKVVLGCLLVLFILIVALIIFTLSGMDILNRLFDWLIGFFL